MGHQDSEVPAHPLGEDTQTQTHNGDHTQDDAQDDAPADSPEAFEDAMKRLEQAVTTLEREDLTLDRAIAIYEEGLRLSGMCQSLLTDAELRIRRVDAKGKDAGPLDLA